ncbi:TolC family protein [Candidatus Endoriftia persephone]|uniref:Outer membrane efflux protein n=3 Tax=Gammaproteobacteria TaxID=1236 RepID=G2FDQ5_9GAMM|nr:TolC family protein [Candidatus Endoriftia persephone]EGV51356.1 outer membrane efflux protein [endosymbiont of Riftia pachyptila (vent Ph05)]EGW55110.1 hypothetical protein TevJSym_af00750 [endosymbiont of Tevnia jerichonana (vent Tica)]USF88283.1 TolC family protein [Candidatus Endoriftia persephone]
MSGRWNRGRLIAALFVFLCAPFSQAAEPLPTPLTLRQALLLADGEHPQLEQLQAALAIAEAAYAGAEADDDLTGGVEAALRVIEPSPNSTNQEHYDSWLKLRLSKRLYDFGRTEQSIAAADAAREGRVWELLELRQQRRLQVMEAFFGVLLADLKYARENEAMSIAFIRFDRAQNRQQLGETSDLEVLRLQRLFELSRRRVITSQNRQRITRSQLAISLNRPDDLPAELEFPTLALGREAGELEPWIEKVLQDNPSLKAVRAAVSAAEQQLHAAQAADNPVIRGELEAGAYQRQLGGRNDMSAALVFELPLFSASRVDAETAQRRAELRERRAELALKQLELRQSVLELWMELQQLQAERIELEVTSDYRELYLDRARARYEMEVSSDLGDSMVRESDIRLKQAQNDFNIALTWAKLDALTGELLTDQVPAEAAEGER